MWISRKQYDALRDEIAGLREKLARAETSADFLRIQHNTATKELAMLRADITGRPQVVPQVERPNSVETYQEAVVEFEDVGDARAKDLGIGWNDLTGEVKYDS